MIPEDLSLKSRFSLQVTSIGNEENSSKDPFELEKSEAMMKPEKVVT